MFKKFIRNTKKYANFLYLGILIYTAIVTIFTAFYVDAYNEPMAYDINNRLGNETDNQSQWHNGTLNPGIFDAQVFIMSNVNTGTNNQRHYYTLPGQTGSYLYRDFSIFIFSNQQANYMIKIDNFTVESGTMNWLRRIDRHSDYSSADISVLLENETGAQREFLFEKIKLYDTPGASGGEDQDGTSNQVPDIIKPYIQMSQGEFNLFIVKRVAADIISVIAGILVGIQFAALRADFRGIERAL